MEAIEKKMPFDRKTRGRDKRRIEQREFTNLAGRI